MNIQLIQNAQKLNNDLHVDNPTLPVKSDIHKHDRFLQKS